MQGNFIEKIYDEARNQIEFYRNHPEQITDEIRSKFEAMYSMLTKALNYSEHSAWGVKWTIEKREHEGAPILETVSGNIILNGGANEMLKLVFGVKPSTPYDATNARIYVGSDSTAERADQKGVLALGSNQASAKLDSGYPQVPADGRTAVVRATFGETVANFAWNEVSLVNGQGGGAIALNRKQASMGTKNGGVWTVQLEVSIVEVS